MLTDRPRKIVVTGASGFVGSAVVKQMIQSGHLPLILQRPSSNPCRLKNIQGYQLFTYETLREERLIEEISRHHPDTFIHLGWRGVAGKERNEIFQIKDNLPLTLDTVEFARSVGCDRWVGIGSQAEYGNANCQVDESFPTNPTTLYGKAKLASCWASLALCQAYDICGSWIRLFDPYGPEDEPYWLIPYLIREMSLGNAPELTKCEQLWDYVYIDDAARGILSVAYEKAPGIFNVGSGLAVPLKTIVEIIKDSVNPRIQPVYGAVDYRPDQVMHLQANIDKIKRATGWEPQIDLERGLSMTVNWMVNS